jgi:hypothetical protein
MAEAMAEIGGDGFLSTEALSRPEVEITDSPVPPLRVLRPRAPRQRLRDGARNHAERLKSGLPTAARPSADSRAKVAQDVGHLEAGLRCRCGVGRAEAGEVASTYLPSAEAHRHDVLPYCSQGCLRRALQRHRLQLSCQPFFFLLSQSGDLVGLVSAHLSTAAGRGLPLKS